MIILAHRGWWTYPASKNSEAALRRAFDAGMGVETDLRDHDGAVVVSHDPPRGDGHVTLDALLDWYAAAGQPGRLALNIKADGLYDAIDEALAARKIERAFLFDMAVPDVMGALRRGLTCFTRESEVEPEPSFLGRAAGVWMDAFESDWIRETNIRLRLDQGLDVALVSPELHGRRHQAAWRAWAPLLSALEGRNVMLCTDLPAEALRMFDETAERAR